MQITDYILPVIDVLLAVLIVKIVIIWLVMFEVLNAKNVTVARLKGLFEMIFNPVFRLIRKVIPNILGVEPGPIIVILLLVLGRIFLVQLLT